jgi:hypothetical protein
MVFGMFE